MRNKQKGSLKIVVIGGGSSYTPEFVEGLLLRRDELPVKQLWLVDVEEGRRKLEIIEGLARRMTAKAGADMEIYSTLNRREALAGADFVVTQFRVGFLEAREKDERIPLSHHVIGQETNGPGGMFKALRTIPVILDICRDMDELCPQAWLINFTNPSGMVTEAAFRFSGRRRVIGLCNNAVNMQSWAAEQLQVPEDKLQMDFAGINHMVFALNAIANGQDHLSELIHCAEEKAQIDDEGITPYVKGLLKELGALPCSYFRYYTKRDEMLKKMEENYAAGKVRAQVVKKVEQELFQKYADPELCEKPPELALRGGARYSDASCRLISSLYNDRGDVQVVNTLNVRQAIPGLPADRVVEVSCRITSNGPEPLPVGNPPEAVLGLIRRLQSFQMLTEEAAVTGDYDKALLAMTMNPLVPGDYTARLLLDELLEAHRKYLPAFSAYFEKNGGGR